MEKLLTKHLTSTNLPQEAAQHIYQSLLENGFFDSPKSLLLLSGGSCINVAAELLSHIPDTTQLHNVLIGLADERWVEPGSSDSNEQQLRDKGVIAGFEQRGAKFISILGSDNPEDAADKTDTIYKEVISETSSIALLAGVGEDGHTLGILPDNDQNRFFRTFSSGKNVTYYELTDTQTNPFKQRVTVTLSGVSKIPLIYIFAVGDNKTSALKHLTLKDTTVNNIPSLGLYLSEGEPILLTDIKV